MPTDLEQTSYAAALAVAVEAARAAGEMLREEFYRPGGPRGSNGHAEIDEPVERLIRDRLLAAFPWSYLGEETGTVHGDPHHRWLVDPNDGTAAFLRGWRGSAVSIAALRDGAPVLGVVYAFAYPDSDGDLVAWAEGLPLTRNGQPIAIPGAEAVVHAPQIVFLSQDADSNPTATTTCVQPARYITLPSIAYRLARVAVGDGLAAVSLSGPQSWDFAAGHALLRAAGGVLVDEDGGEVVYDSGGHSSTCWCFGGAAAVVQDLCRQDWNKVFQPDQGSRIEDRGSRIEEGGGLRDSQSSIFDPRSSILDLRSSINLVRPAPGQAIVEASRLSRAQGCLLGQLCGDSLGGLVEFRDEATIRDRYPLGVRDLRDGGTWGNLAGQPTDDSEMALMLARTLAAEGRYDPERVLDSYCHWWPHAWDRGSTLSQALGATRGATTAAERWQLVQHHASQSSQSNGCLMRISPLGIFAAGRLDRAAEWARQDCQLTHPNPVCQDACAVFVKAIATAIRENADREACYAAALAEAANAGVEESVRRVLEEARTQPPREYGQQMGWVLIALQNAFYQLLHASNLEEGVVDTVMRGGDTDTNGAIAGALLGAVHGRTAVPARWLHAVLSCRPLRGTATRHPQPMEFWPVDALELAEALLYRGLNG